MIRQVVLHFVDAVNAHDVPRILSLMSDDPIFVDAYGGVEDKADMARGRPDYFRWFPDYRIEAEQLMVSGDTAAVFGNAGGVAGGGGARPCAGVAGVLRLQGRL